MFALLLTHNVYMLKKGEDVAGEKVIVVPHVPLPATVLIIPAIFTIRPMQLLSK
jgi:hypothetical protein